MQQRPLLLEEATITVNECGSNTESDVTLGQRAGAKGP